MAQNRDQETRLQGSGRHRERTISQGQAPHKALAFPHSALPAGNPSPPRAVPNCSTLPPSAGDSAKQKRMSPFSRRSEQSRARGGRARPALQPGAVGMGPSCQVEEVTQPICKAWTCSCCCRVPVFLPAPKGMIRRLQQFRLQRGGGRHSPDPPRPREPPEEMGTPPALRELPTAADREDPTAVL